MAHNETSDLHKISKSLDKLCEDFEHTQNQLAHLFKVVGRMLPVRDTEARDLYHGLLENSERITNERSPRSWAMTKRDRRLIRFNT